MIRDINAIRLNEEWVSIRFSRDNPWKKGLMCFFSFLFGICKSLIKAPAEIVSLVRNKSASLVFFSSTKNQTSSLFPIADLFNEAFWIRVNHSKNSDDLVALRFPTVVVSVVSIVTLPLSLVFLVLFITSPAGSKSSLALRARAVAFSFDELLRSYGYYVAARILIRAHSIRTLVMSNDHNSINRAFALAGLHLGLETVYVQHAPVSHLFPTLIFKRAFLDGDVSAQIYRQKPTNTLIEVVGAPRYDNRFQSLSVRCTKCSKSVSLCLNKLDNKDRFIEYLEAFIKLGWHVVVRPHPNMSRADLAFLPSGLEIDRSDVVSHLSKVNFLVAGSSGVLLDAYMAGVIPLMAVDLSTAYDYYRFVERGAVYTIDIDGLEKLDTSFDGLVLQGLKVGMVQFNAAIGTPYTYEVASEVHRRIEAFSR